MGGHSEHKLYPGQAAVAIGIFLVVLFFLFWGGNSQVVQIAKEYFDLTTEDMRMIPVSGIVFMAFYFGMHKFLFSPMLELIETREAKTTGAQSTAQDLKKATEQAEAEYNEKLLAARMQGAQAKISELNKARSIAQELLDKTQARVSSELKAGRTEITRNTDQLKVELTQRSEDLIVSAVKKIIEVPGQVRSGLH